MYKIFLIEDDPAISKAVEEHLVLWGYEVRGVKDFQRVWEDFLDFSPHLVVLDLSLPFQNGFLWCEKIRESSKTPIIFLSGADSRENIVTAINLGGDDFIPKPFDLSVLTAKIQAVLRRTYSFPGGADRLERAGAVLDLGDACLTYEGKRLELTKNELKIVRVLLENAGHPVSRRELMQRLWESESFIDGNTLTVSMTRLRKKLSELGLTDFIVTQKGLGYLIH